MADYDLVVIGAGLSGLAAGIRQARFDQRVLILEQHAIPGGLNSYYRRQGFLFETGLHAITNFPTPGDRAAPLHRLFRQLKIKPKTFSFEEQIGSEIHFGGDARLTFTNDFAHLTEEVRTRFPHQIDGFVALAQAIDAYNAFAPAPYISARQKVETWLSDPLLVDMLFCPAMYYGSACEGDMDFGQFVIMFRALFKEGFFRIAGGIKHLLDHLVDTYKGFGGEIRFKTAVATILLDQDRAIGVTLADGRSVTAKNIISTAGYPNTLKMLGLSSPDEIGQTIGRLSFVESIHLLKRQQRESIRHDRTIIFFNKEGTFQYRRPDEDVDVQSGVICMPENFTGTEPEEHFQIRITHMANYDNWRKLAPEAYRSRKEEWRTKSHTSVSELIGRFDQDVIFYDCFTPITIERYTGKMAGAIYGSPIKTKEGLTPARHCYIAGTDQGFLGIVGSMLSGVSIVNQHTLTD